MHLPLILCLFAWFALLLPGTHGATAPRGASAGRPSIELVRGRTVRVRVPAGLHSVTLEQCTNARLGRWETVGTKATAQKAGTVDFQIARPVSLRFLRVKGIAAAAMPSALAGARLFLADPVQSAAGFFPLASSLGGTGVLATADATSSQQTAPRLVAESDIWRVDGDRLYFFNELRGLQVFDISNPDDPALLGQMRAPGQGEQMYLLDSPHVVLLTRGSNLVRLPVITLASDALPSSTSESGAVVVVDVANGRPVEVARVPYRGWLRESRRVGDVLYVVSEVWNQSSGSLEIVSIDLANPAQPVLRDSLAVPGWGAVLHATDRFLFVVSSSEDWSRSHIDLIDISSPIGVLSKRGRITTAGRVEDKFKMRLAGDVLTAVSSARGELSVSPNMTPDPGGLRTVVQTFSVANPDAPTALGSLEVGHGESLFATRFDDERLYVVTFFQVDPLWVIDLSQPATPRLLGELKVPGFSTYIEPLGDRLVTIGRLDGRAAVALFDVSDPAQPRTLSQLPLGDGQSWSEATYTEKAFNVMPEENLIVVPYSGYDQTSGYASRVQLIDLTRDALVPRGVIDHGLAARRTTMKGNRLLALSQHDLLTVDLSDRDRPRVTSEVEIAWRVDRVFLAGDHLLQIGGAADERRGASQTLSVSTAVAPEAILASTELDRVPVIGAAVRNGRLYLAQRSLPAFNSLVYLPGQPTTPVARPPFILSVFDLTSLPALPRLARVESDVDLGDTMVLTAVWPRPDLLVWVRGGDARSRWPGFGWRGGPPLQILPVLSTAVMPSTSPAVAISARPSAQSAAASLSPRVWFRRSGVEAVAFDVSDPAAPLLKSQLSMRTDSSSDWSDPFAADGKLFVSAMAMEDFVTIGATPASSTRALSRRFRHFMKVVDFADAAKPVIGPDVNLPGRLIGLSGSGARLYTAGCRYKPDATPMRERAVHVSTFDGTVATFVDQLPLADDGPYAVDLETLLIGIRGPGSTSDRIEAWQLGSDGKFRRTGEVTALDASSLAVVRGVLVAGSAYDVREAFDVTDAANLRKLATLPPAIGWSAGDLSGADGSPGRGLWQPLGSYGVEVTLFPR